MVIDKPWGQHLYFEYLNNPVSQITIYPSGQTSLHSHVKRNEMLSVVSGEGIIYLDDERFLIKENDTIFVPKLVKHRILNYGKFNLLIVEVNTGIYEEKDTYRVEDIYGRL